MSLKLNVSFFISIISGLSVCLNQFQTAYGEEVKSGIVKLRVFTPENNSLMFKVDLPSFAKNLSPIKIGQQDKQEGEEENMASRMNNMRNKLRILFPVIGGPESNANTNKDGENDEKEKGEPTPPDHNEEEKKIPRLRLLIFRRKLIPPSLSSGNNSLSTEDCDKANSEEHTEGYVQNAKNNSENVSDSEGKNEKTIPTLTNNTVKTSEDVNKESIESQPLEVNQLQEADKFAIISPTLITETAESNIVIIIVTATISFILLLIILLTVINHVRARKHRDLLDIEKFRRENGRENASNEKNQQDFYGWVKTRMIPSHYKSQGRGREPTFPENAASHQQEKNNGNIYSINPI